VITKEERESIINEAVERAIKLTPDLARQLLMQRLNEDKIKLAFLEKLFEEDPKYKQWTQIIKSVVEKKEKQYPGNLTKVFEEALPEIKSMIANIDKLDFTNDKKPTDLTFKDKSGDPGEL